MPFPSLCHNADFFTCICCLYAVPAQPPKMIRLRADPRTANHCTARALHWGRPHTIRAVISPGRRRCTAPWVCAKPWAHRQPSRRRRSEVCENSMRMRAHAIPVEHPRHPQSWCSAPLHIQARHEKPCFTTDPPLTQSPDTSRQKLTYGKRSAPCPMRWRCHLRGTGTNWDRHAATCHCSLPQAPWRSPSRTTSQQFGWGLQRPPAPLGRHALQANVHALPRLSEWHACLGTRGSAHATVPK